MALNKQSGAWVVIFCPGTQSFLLGKRSQTVKKPGIWNFFGGRLNPDEDAPTAVRRELFEETGFRSTESGAIEYGGPAPGELIELGFVDGLRKLHYYLLLTETEVAPTLNLEHAEYCWFTPDKFPYRLNRAANIAVNIGLVQKALLAAGSTLVTETTDDGDATETEVDSLDQ